MHTFEITIQRRNKQGRWPVVVEQSQPDSLPIRTEGELALDLKELTGQTSRQEYGTVLGRALFREEIREAFAQARATSTTAETGLRILLVVEDPDLKPLHWERLCAPIKQKKWDLLSTHHHFRLSHYLPSLSERPYRPPRRNALRMLVLLANPAADNPYNLPRFDALAIINQLPEALGQIPYDLLTNEDVPHRVGPPTLVALKQQLSRENYTLLYLVAHGGYNRRRKESALFLTDEQDQVQVITTDTLIQQLDDLPQLPHFAFLATCESATPEAEEGGAMGGLAQSLIRSLGIPAIVAMTEKVSVVTATTISAHFYASLYDTGLVDLALVKATAALPQADDITVPALYSRLKDHPLFEVNPQEPTPADIELGLQRLESQLVAHAPILLTAGQQQAEIVRRNLRAETGPSQAEREAALDQLNQWTERVLEITFNRLALMAESELPPLTPAGCPFPGLKAFQPAEAAYFFGRERIINELLEKLTHHPFLPILGASGSGKSSLVLAGLVPRLQAANPDLSYHYLTPGNQPLTKLEAHLASLTPDQPALLVIDQFEELFTLCHEVAHRERFIERLLSLIDPQSTTNNQQSKIVLTMRADFWGDCFLYPALKEAMLAHQYALAPMTTAELRSAMEQQANTVGLRFEADLSHTILAAVQDEPGAMPLLQHLLREMWQRRHGRWLLTSEYHQLGGIQRAIAHTADALYQQLDESHQALMRHLFLRLTHSDEARSGDEAARDTRQRVPFSDLVPADTAPHRVRELVERLATARLVVTTEQEVEVAHEALIRHWPRLRQWLTEDRELRPIRQEINREATAWDEANRPDELLPRWHHKLAEAVHLAPRLGLTETEQAYLQACVELRDREAAEKEAQRQRELAQARQLAAEQQKRAEEQAAAAASLRTRAMIAAGVAVLAVMFALGAAFFWNQATQQTERANQQAATAEAESHIARSRELAAYANARMRTNYELALLLSLEAAMEASQANETTLAHDVLLAVLDQPIQIGYRLEQEWINQVVWSKDESQLLLASYTGPVTIWSVADNVPLLTLNHDDSVREARWNGDESQILTASEDGTAKVWSATDGRLLLTLPHDDWVIQAIWNRDETMILTASADGTVNLWSATDGSRQLTLHHDDYVSQARWNEAETMILTASSDNTAKVWSATDGELLLTLPHDYYVNSVVWNETESQILTASWDGTAKVWSATDGELLLTLPHDYYVDGAVWNGDESQILTFGWDNRAKVWSATDDKLLFILSHDDRVTQAMWNDTEGQILTASEDGTAKVWSATDGSLQVTLPHGDRVIQAKWYEAINRILTVSGNGTIRVWQLGGGGGLPTLHHDGPILDIMWNEAESQILTASGDGLTKVWSAEGELLFSLPHRSDVTQAIWNNDETLILTASYDDTANVWSANDGSLQLTLPHDDDVTQAIWNNDETLILTISEGAVNVWSATEGQLLFSLDHEGFGVQQARWNRDESQILTASWDDTAKVWSANDGSLLFILPHDQDVTQAIWNEAESQILTASEDGTAKLWSATDGGLRFTLNHDNVDEAIWSGDETMILTIGWDGMANVWSATDGTLQFTLHHDEPVLQGMWNKDNSQILTASGDGTAKVWSAVEGALKFTLHHDQPVLQAIWSKDNSQILTASGDGTAKVWSAVEGALQFTLSHNEPVVFQAMWNKDDSRILTVSGDGLMDGTARIWYTQLADLIETGCDIAPRNLTLAEWQQFMGYDQPYRETCGD